MKNGKGWWNGMAVTVALVYTGFVLHSPMAPWELVVHLISWY